MKENNSVIFIKKTIGIIIVVSIIVPILMEHLLFRNTFYSTIDNKDWASFFGSYLGGIIGGIGTLLAVLVTTRETRVIQKDNKSFQSSLLKKQFTDDIAKLIATYITDISGYYNAQKINERNENENGSLQDVNRRKSVETFYLLHIKLDKIKQAKELLNKLDEIHNKYCFINQNSIMIEFLNQTELLKELSIRFINDYCED